MAKLEIEVSLKDLDIVKAEFKRLKAEIRRLKKGFLKCKTCKHKELITVECRKDDCKYEGKCGNQK